MRMVFSLRTAFVVLSVSLSALVVCPEAQAQEFGRVGDFVAGGTAYSIFARPGEATVQVLVWTRPAVSASLSYEL